MAHFAWSEIRYGAEVDKDGTLVGYKTIPAGQQVSKSKLGVDDAGWEQLIEAGSVREYEYPDMPEGYNGSPIDFLRAQLAHVAGAVEGSGTGYEGPPLEEAMMHPALAGVVEEEAEEKKEEVK